MGRASGKRARGALASAFEDAVQRALKQLARTGRDPETAVHEWRKALRRARSIVRLARPFLDDAAEQELASVLRAGHRAGGELRDRDVLAGALAGAGDDAAGLAEQVNAERTRQRARGEARFRLSEHARALETLPARFAAALAPRIAVDELARALARSYRRVRRAAKQALASRDAEDVHDFRRRVKALQHQLEVAEAAPGLDAREARRGCARLAEDLGEFTDALLVEQLIVDAEGGVTGPARKRLVDALASQRAERLERLMAGAAPLTAVRPRRFRRRLLG